MSSYFYKVKKNCLICEKEFYVKPSRIKKGGGRYCSKKCYAAWQSLNTSGENNSFWKGGLSFEPYTTDWTETLRRSIRERDKYICQVCGERQGDRAFSVHHIDYNKKNCNPNNLITLCEKCHKKTNGNRKYWVKFLVEMGKLKADKK